MAISPRNVACPECSAPIGAPCRDSHGLHPERIKALKAHVKETKKGGYKPKNTPRPKRAREQAGAHTINRLEHKATKEGKKA